MSLLNTYVRAGQFSAFVIAFIFIGLTDVNAQTAKSQGALSIQDTIPIRKLIGHAYNEYEKGLIPQAIVTIRQALREAQKINHHYGIVESYLSLQYFYAERNIDSAIYYGRIGLVKAKEANISNGVAVALTNLVDNFITIGQFTTARQYLIEAEAYSESHQKLSVLGMNYYNLIDLNIIMDNQPEAATYITKLEKLWLANRAEKKFKKFGVYLTICRAQLLLHQHRPRPALRFLQVVSDSLKNIMLADNIRQDIACDVLLFRGRAYAQLKDWPQAAHYFRLRMADPNPSRHGTIEARIGLAKVLVQQDSLNQAETILRVALDSARLLRSRVLIPQVSSELAAVVNQQKKYRDAYQLLQLSKASHDSIYNASHIQSFARLETRYQNQEKAKEIKILQQKAQIDALEASNQRNQKNVALLGLGLLLVVIGFIYSRYRAKQLSHRQMETQQKLIESKNQALEKLAAERELLVQEVHHRVKNNLQMVLSLLRSQARKLQNNDALSALQDSQRRIKCIALIHQDLSESSDQSIVDMSLYMKKLVYYLTQTIDGAERIQIRQDVSPIAMRFANAVPLGLIVNEAVTNALKYAFPDGRPGEILISFYPIYSDFYRLIIRDNGIGLPVGFSMSGNQKPTLPAVTGKSLGLQLIEGLTDQLSGQLELTNQQGVTVQVTFQDHTAVRSESKQALDHVTS